MRQAYQTDEQIWNQTKASNSPKPVVTAVDCKSYRYGKGAAMVAVCDQHLQKNGILATEGLLETMRCRAGMQSITVIIEGWGLSHEKARLSRFGLKYRNCGPGCSACGGWPPGAD